MLSERNLNICNAIQYNKSFLFWLPVFRIQVVRALPSLRFLDSQVITEPERDEAAGRGRRPSSDATTLGPLDLAAIEKLYPTQTWRQKGPPENVTETSSSKYGRVLARSRSGGRGGGHSEGNRFIRNNDL